VTGPPQHLDARSRRRALAALAAVAALLRAPAPAGADDKAVCAEAYHQSQVLRDQGKLVLARAQIAVCRAACPAHVSGDCEDWLADVESRLASVVISARDAAGNVIADARVVVDGKRADARGPIEVDPGAHVVRVEHAGTTVEKRVELGVGERARRVEVLFPGGERAARPALAARAAAAPAPAPPGSGPPTATWVLGIGGLVTLGAAATLAVHGHLRRADLEECSPRCDLDRLDSIRTEWWVAGGIAGAGALAVGAATVIWASAPAPSSGAQRAPARASVGIAPRRGGGDAVLRGAF
jgi:hypothetical protein